MLLAACSLNAASAVLLSTAPSAPLSASIAAPVLPRPTLQVHTTRRMALLAALLTSSAAPVSAASWENPFAPADRSGLKNKPLEQLRILLQDEADAIQYAGKEGLAPGGAPPATGLLLIPVLQLRQRLKALAPALARYDADSWSKLRFDISSGDFTTVGLKRIFNAYSDNICAHKSARPLAFPLSSPLPMPTIAAIRHCTHAFLHRVADYASETAEANAYLLGGSTPSSSQTTQYLLRNEAIKQLTELRDEIDYQQGLDAQAREVVVAQEAMSAAIKAFDDYFKLAPPDQLAMARRALDLE